MFDKIVTTLKKQKFLAYSLIAVLCLIICFEIYKSIGSKKKDVVMVESAHAELKDLDLYLRAIGTVSAEYSANITSQVNGQLIKIHFKEGDLVKKDELLAEIDDKPFKAVLVQYQGQLLRDEALLDNAKIDLERYQELWKQKSTSKQTLDTQLALVKQYEGAVLLDKGLVDGAQVNLDYCKIKAPFDGRIGLKYVTEGNNIQATNTNGIALMNMVTPISVVFSIPENNLPEIIEKQKHEQIKIDAYDSEQKNLIASGVLKAVDNQINSSTGTVQLKASFENKDGRLYPNQFVNIKLLAKSLKQVLTVPTSSVQFGANGPYLYAINDKIAKVTHVKLGENIDNSTIIESGISENQEVVKTGLDKLTDGSRISADYGEKE